MKRETFRVVKKLIRRKGYGRTKNTYCIYNIENEKHSFRKRCEEDSEIFKVLSTHTVTKRDDRYDTRIFVDGIFHNDVLIGLENIKVQ